MNKRLGWVNIGGTVYSIVKDDTGWRAINSRGVDCGYLGSNKEDFINSWGAYNYKLEPEKCGLTLFLERNTCK